MPAHLSIVIPVYNNWWMTARALRELDRLREASSVAFETIVVDNASTDETQASIREFSWVRYLRHESNTNFAGACNSGARAAEAPLVLFLNNDAYPLGDALAPLVRAFDRDEVAIAGGALFFEDGAMQGAGFVVLPNAHWHYFCRNLPAGLDDVTQSRDALAVSGAAMAVRSDWFLESGGFDESFINGFEDVDLCMRAREAGRAIRYVAPARFAHYEGASAGRFDREADNERRFFDRWASAFARMPRTARGSVGAISIAVSPNASPLLAAGLEDLESGLREFGHPLLRGAVRPWQRLDRRFRTSAALGWFVDDVSRPGIRIARRDDGAASIETLGSVALRVPWLPCAASARVAKLALRQSADPSCTTVALAGIDSLPPEHEAFAAIDELIARFPNLRLAVPSQNAALAARFGDRAVVAPLLGEATPAHDVACILQAGLTDQSAFGNVLLAQAELATVALASDELRSIFAPDVALMVRGAEIAAQVARLLEDTDERKRYAALCGADARRRFSPRRSAIRVVDLLCAARFGLERSAAARSNSPIRS